MSEYRTTKDREEALLQALLLCPNVATAAKKIGVSRSYAYKTTMKDDFREKLDAARQQAIESAVNYLQASLVECSQILLKIIRDENTPPQVRVNAINAAFANAKGFMRDNGVTAEMAVRIVDSI